jgi:hypothetical protein
VQHWAADAADQAQMWSQDVAVMPGAVGSAIGTTATNISTLGGEKLNIEEEEEKKRRSVFQFKRNTESYEDQDIPEESSDEEEKKIF